MTENHRPRHLHDLTAEMPAVKLPPRHAAPGTGESAAVRPPRTSAIPRINADRTQYPPIQKQSTEQSTEPTRHGTEPWWKRTWRWIMGA